MNPTEDKEPKKRSIGARNRRAGNQFECQVVTAFKKAGYPHVVTARSESKRTDDSGIDLINANEFDNGRLPYGVQCKNTCTSVNYAKLLTGLPKKKDVINVILHKFTELRGDSGFHPRGYYAILDMKDFMDMVTRIQQLEAQAKAAELPFNLGIE